MKQQRQHSTAVSQPVDSSLEAYKTWIMEIAQRLTTVVDPLQFTELEWTKSWRDHWNTKRTAQISREISDQ